MPKRIITSVILTSLLFPLIFIPVSLARDKPLTVGIRYGLFIPQDRYINGSTAISCNEEGSPTSGVVWGFGNGSDISVYVTYFFSNWGLMLEEGFRSLENKVYLGYTTGRDNYENSLTIYPITLSSIYKLPLSNSENFPYFGAGMGVYISNWEEITSQWRYEKFHQAREEGSLTPIGFHFLAGYNLKVNYDLYANLEFRYSFINGDWNIENKDTKRVIEYRNLNIGGTSLNIGLGYKF
jgi:outer membrane protein W